MRGSTAGCVSVSGVLTKCSGVGLNIVMELHGVAHSIGMILVLRHSVAVGIVQVFVLVLT